MEEIDVSFIGEGSRAAWQPGDVVKSYSLLARIATGGMAEIWLARQAGLKGFEKLVVIKRMVDALCEDPEFVEMFLDEARIAAQLNHPGIVQIYDLGEKDGAYFIAMEYLAGENLAVVVREGLKRGIGLALTASTRIVATAAEALGHAHAQKSSKGEPLGVVHRDVSPQNLIVTYDGHTKIVDFGIAKAAVRSSLTVGGKLKGKFAYMSPEQARGEHVDGRSDEFALGIILHELVTRTRLFKTDDAFQAIHEVGMGREIAPAALKNPDVPIELSDIIGRALAPGPDERYATCRDFAQALEAWLKTQTVVPDPPQIASHMSLLFGERIAQRMKLLDQARAGDLTPSSRARLPAAARNKSGLSGEHTPRRRRLILGALFGLALGSALGTAVLLRNRAVEPPRHPLVTVETEPPGASVEVDGAKLGVSPLTVTTLALGKHQVVAHVEGRVPAKRAFSLTDPGERQTIVLTLTPIVRVELPQPPPVEVPPVQPPVQPPPVQPPVKPPDERPAPVAKGRLSLNTEPWTQVFLGARKLGETPILDLSLPAGSYTLKVVNEEKGISKAIMVEIKPGQSTVMKLKL